MQGQAVEAALYIPAWAIVRVDLFSVSILAAFAWLWLRAEP
ncbi:hypothetical protein [Haematospirillum sp. 15-248]|nr:hypothetical protein [Haematospirillum sp. 15-248]